MNVGQEFKQLIEFDEYLEMMGHKIAKICNLPYDPDIERTHYNYTIGEGSLVWHESVLRQALNTPTREAPLDRWLLRFP